MNSLRFLFIFVFLLSPLSLQGKTLDRDQVQVRVYSDVPELSGKVTLGVHYKLKPGWHIYWKNPGDSGAAPKFQLEGGVILSIQWPYPKRIPLGTLVNYGYEGETVLLLETDLKKPNPVLKLEWLVCKVECIPGFGEVVISEENVQSYPPLLAAFSKKVPTLSPDWRTKYIGQKDASYSFYLFPEKAGEAIENIFIYPEDGNTFLTKAPTIAPEGKGFRVSVPYSINRSPAGPKTFTVVTELTSKKMKAFPVVVEPPSSSFLYGLVLAFLGGLLLNLMPCVFPVLFLKVYAFLEGNQQAIRKSAWLYTAGVLTSFCALGALLLLFRLTGNAVGWGFQLQSPSFVLSMAVLFIVMGLFFLDLVRLERWNILSSLSNKASSYFSGDFATGVLAVVVASPCTAPFMGVALGLTLFLSPLESLGIFLVLGIGLSLPIPMLAYFPWFIRKLPRSGPWLLRVKKCMAIPLFATTLWLFWVFSQQVGSPSREALESRWHPFDRVKIEEARKERPVFIDFTASWCITCQVNKKLVLETKEVMELFEKHNTYLVRADWTNYNAKITQALASYQRSSLPLYVFYARLSKSYVLLPEILTRSSIEKLFEKGNKQ